MGESPAQAGGKLNRDIVSSDMVEPATHRFSVDEFYRMGETGIIGPEARVELLDGEIIDMAPIGPFHGSTVKKLNHLFSGPAKGRWIVAVQDPVRLSPESEPQPDLMLVRPAADFYADRHPQPEDVFLLVEVAETTVRYDGDRKIPAYGKAGIREVWLINLPEKVVEVFREPHFTGYGSVQKFDSREKISPQAFPDLRIDVSTLLKRTS